jgi:aminoglycoside phosphotransferase (APT) family kinase protein
VPNRHQSGDYRRPVTNRGIVIDGDTVSRPAYPWTPTVHALLRHLRLTGFNRVPIPLAITDGREMLSYIPGTSGADAWAMVVPEDGLRAMARFLREYHEATEGFVPPAGSRWAFRDDGAASGEVICHGDFGPWNVVWREGHPVGLVDFDFAGPGNPLLDVAYALDYVAPFCDDEEATRWRAYSSPPNRRRRIAVFADAYGLPSPTGLFDAVIASQHVDIEHVRALAAIDMEPQRTWVQDGVLDQLAERIRWSTEHQALFE